MGKLMSNTMSKLVVRVGWICMKLDQEVISGFPRITLHKCSLCSPVRIVQTSNFAEFNGTSKPNLIRFRQTRPHRPRYSFEAGVLNIGREPLLDAHPYRPWLCREDGSE